MNPHATKLAAGSLCRPEGLAFDVGGKGLFFWDLISRLGFGFWVAVFGGWNLGFRVRGLGSGFRVVGSGSGIGV